MSNWFTSAFDGFAELSPLSNSARKRTREGRISGSCSKHGARTSRREVDIELWIDRHQPHKKDDLAVHKKKIQEVEMWLQEAFLPGHTKGPSLLLMTGPAGCGKSTTLHVLGKEMDIEVQEWVNPVSYTHYREQDEKIFRTEYIEGDTVRASSQISMFADFLQRANRYPSLHLLGERHCNRKLLFIKDFPNVVLRDPKNFHCVLRKYKVVGQSPAVFIVTDNTKGDCSMKNLFPQDIQEELEISNISFNPIAQTAMIKVLGKVAASEAKEGIRRFNIPQKSTLEALVESSGGDLRSAINALHFACLKDMSDLERAFTSYSSLSSSKSKKTTKVKQVQKKKRETKRDSALAAIGGRDTSLFLFRALGKVLYCKRNVDIGLEYPKLPPHLSHHQRCPLIANPEDIQDKTHLTADSFNLFLQQNYIQFFGSVEDVQRASQYLSDADCLTTEWTGRMSMDDYMASVAIRGIMHSNTNPETSTWRPLHKPQWFAVQKNYKEGIVSAKQLFLMAGWSGEEVQTQFLPYMSIIRTPLQSARHTAFIQEVGRFHSLNSVPRSHVDLLDEYDTGVDEAASLMQDGGQCCVTQTDTGTASPVVELEEEEEVVIEDYDDD